MNGTIRLDNRKGHGTGRRAHLCWVVACAPHVALRLKRVFARVDKGAFGELLLTDTPEVARELVWFLDRYPMTLADPVHAAHLATQAAKHRDAERAVADILAGYATPYPIDLAMPLRAYQSRAVDLTLATGSLLLADEVGLGKSAVGIAVLSDPRARPGLVVTMTHLPRQWCDEFARFAPSLDVYAAKTGNPEVELAKRFRKQPLFRPDVYVVSYSKLAGWAAHLKGLVRGVVFDEIQEVRHDGSSKHRAAAAIAARAHFRLGLSATPIHNYGGEIFNVLDVIRPDALGSSVEFHREWCGPFDGKLKDPVAFGEYARAEGLMLRRTRADVGRELPELTKVRHAIDCDLDALDAVEDTAAELARLILAQGAEVVKGERMRAAEELSWRLRQATGIGKARPVADFVRLLVDAGEKVLLAGWHREVYALWADRLKDLSPAFYTGAETGPQKEEALRRFKAGETPILIMSLRSGAGVDGLQGICRTVVFGELDWTYACHHQFIGRIHRDGQGEPVVAYYLVSDHGADPVIADVLGIKRQQLEGILDPGGNALERLQTDGDHIKRLATQYLGRKAGVAQDAVA